MEMFALIAIAVAVGALIWFFVEKRHRRPVAAERQDDQPSLQSPDAAARGPAPAPSAAAAQRFDDAVQFTVYRPHEIEPLRWYSLLAFVHLTERRPEEPDAPDPIAE